MFQLGGMAYVKAQRPERGGAASVCLKQDMRVKKVP